MQRRLSSGHNQGIGLHWEDHWCWKATQATCLIRQGVTNKTPENMPKKLLKQPMNTTSQKRAPLYLCYGLSRFATQNHSVFGFQGQETWIWSTKAWFTNNWSICQDSFWVSNNFFFFTPTPHPLPHESQCFSKDVSLIWNGSGSRFPNPRPLANAASQEELSESFPSWIQFEIY